MRFGMIGTNFVSDFLLDAAADARSFTLGAVYSRTLARAQAFAGKYRAQYGEPRLYDSLEALAADPEIDAVYIASPNVCHRQQAMQMLRAGKHVLCEKPMALNSRELEEMLGCAKENGRLLLEAMRIAHTPQTALLRQAVGELGQLRRAQIGFCQYSSRYDRFLAGEPVNTFNPALGNAALLDLGVYCLALMVLLFGAPASISAQATRLDNGFEAAGSITAVYPGMLCALGYSKVSAGYGPNEVQGELGTLRFDRVTMTDQIEQIDRASGARTVLRPQSSPRHDMTCELDAFCAMARGERDAAPFLELTRTVTRLMDEARRQTGLVFPTEAAQ